MRLAIVTEDGEVPIRSEDLATEIERRLSPLTRLATRSAIRRAISECAENVKQQTVYLDLSHK